MEADKRAEEAARQAEIAKTLPKVTGPDVFTVYFDPGKIAIKPEGVSELEKAAAMIKENPGAIVKIHGHADNTPVVYSKFRNNWLLSQARAEAVKNYLVDKLGASCLNIWSLGIKEEHRGKGIATTLVSDVMIQAYKLGARFASVGTQFWNVPAYMTYAKLGFIPYQLVIGRTLEFAG
jgi:GNAT superfamily N-acetyltransferase